MNFTRKRIDRWFKYKKRGKGIISMLMRMKVKKKGGRTKEMVGYNQVI